MSPQQHYKRRSKEAGGIKGLIRLTDSPDQPIDRPLWHTVTIAIIWAPLRGREDGCQRSSHYLSAIYRSERERERDGERDTDTKTWDAIFEVHLQSTDFSSAQSLWAISTCNNPPPLSLRTAWYQTSGSVCLPFHPSVAKLCWSKLGKDVSL